MDEVEPAACAHLALLEQTVQRGRGHDDDVDRLSTLEADGDGVVRRSHGGSELGYQFVVRRGFILRDQFQIGGGESAGSHDLDLVRAPRNTTRPGS